MEQKVYIKAFSHISAQQPMSEDWYSSLCEYAEPYVRAIDPDFKQFIPPMQARRMGLIMKRALSTSLDVMKKTGIEHPDAIITGTGMGCLENTELILDSLCHEGEQTLKPTHFMQSTHNTISSLVAIHTGSHGYNSTFAHGGISFESALFDAFLQFRLGKIKNALVGVHDELTPAGYEVLKRGGFHCAKLNSEASVAFMLDTEKSGAVCELSSVRIFNRPALSTIVEEIGRMLKQSGDEKLDAVVCGYNGNLQNDKMYDELVGLLGEVPVLKYKNIFGESYAASGLGVYVSACCLNKESLPEHLTDGKPVDGLKNILFVNHYRCADVSLVLLKRM